MQSYVDHHGYESFDPYDGLMSSYSSLIPFESVFLKRCFQQSVRLSPFNLRPILKVDKIEHTKTLTDFASANSFLYGHYGDERYKSEAIVLFKKIEAVGYRTNGGTGWGLRFPFATRFIDAGESTPNIFQTINACHAFLDGYEFLNDGSYLSLAESAFGYLEFDLGFEEKGDEIFWYYWSGLKTQIYNVSGLMIGLCARFYDLTKDDRFLNFTVKLINYIKNNQNIDGSWCYSKDDRGGFIDGFHTGYILEGLSRAKMAGVNYDDRFFRKGVDFYLNSLFEAGFPKYFSNSLKPFDIQNMAQSLQTLTFLCQLGIVELSFIDIIFDNVDREFWHDEGYYKYRKTRWGNDKVPMHRWGTGPMLLALTYYLCSVEGVK